MRDLVTTCLEVLAILVLAAAAAVAVEPASLAGALATAGVVLFAGSALVELLAARAADSAPAPSLGEVDAL